MLKLKSKRYTIAIQDGKEVKIWEYLIEFSANDIRWIRESDITVCYDNAKKPPLHEGYPDAEVYDFTKEDGSRSFGVIPDFDEKIREQQEDGSMKIVKTIPFKGNVIIILGKSYTIDKLI
jgi:hypothetical protein